MASFRPGFLSRGTLCPRPWAQLEKQLSSLRLSTPAATASGCRHSQVRRNSSLGGSDSDFGLAGSNSILATLDTASMGTFGTEAADGSGNDDSSSGSKRSRTMQGFARAIPASPSYFARHPRFSDSYLRLQELLRKYGHLPVLPPDQVERVAWRSLRDYRMGHGEQVKAPQYSRCIAIVKHLHKIHPAVRPPILEEILAEFRREINPYDNVAKPIPIDRFGRALGVGRRKTSVARAWVVEGTGEVLVNGKSLSGAFGRVHDRESATWALRATDRMDKYNVWALVDGGGTTGQAEALTMAVAKGLAAHEPALKTALRKAGCISRDPRMVERKKHGHLKARKSPTWVKR